jgi:osmotically-inducible protein OsmY
MTTTQHLTDHQLKEAICAELAWTPSVKADQVGVALIDGAATLSGEVGSYPEKEAAVAAALRVRGVTAVADEIVVHYAWDRREDADVARDVSAAIAATVVLPVGSVKATVHDHVVTLSGTVTWQYQREAAHRAVATSPGVTSVRNMIGLKAPIGVSLYDTKEKITAALSRNAQLDAQHVKLTLSGSTVTLTGSVSSWAEKRQAEHATWCAPGVTNVDNQLRIAVTR